MKFLYVTDLHGDVGAYVEALELAVEKRVAAIVNGGDLLPKGTDVETRQKDFLRGFMRRHLECCAERNIDYYAMFGNDDLKSGLPYWEELLDEFNILHDISLKALPFGDFKIYGINYVLDYPFGLKDWTILEHAGWKRPRQLSDALVSTRHGLEKVEDEKAFFFRRPTMVDLLNDFSKLELDMRKTVLVCHTPPTGHGLDVLVNGCRVGSESLERWIRKNRPLLTLHGHVHESPDISNCHYAYIGDTLAIQPGRRSLEAYFVLISLETNGSIEFERIPCQL